MFLIYKSKSTQYNQLRVSLSKEIPFSSLVVAIFIANPIYLSYGIISDLFVISKRIRHVPHFKKYSRIQVEICLRQCEMCESCFRKGSSYHMKICVFHCDSKRVGKFFSSMSCFLINVLIALIKYMYVCVYHICTYISHIHIRQLLCIPLTQFCILGTENMMLQASATTEH